MNVDRKWALVTGASGGLGAEFSAILAEKGANLVLIARNADRLDRMAADLRARFGVEVQVERSDLSAPGAADTLVQQIRHQGVGLDILIANAGQGLHGPFIDQSAEAIDSMLQLNVSSLTSLTHAVAKVWRSEPAATSCSSRALRRSCLRRPTRSMPPPRPTFGILAKLSTPN